MNNKIYLLTAIMAFASVGAMLLQPTMGRSSMTNKSVFIIIVVLMLPLVLMLIKILTVSLIKILTSALIKILTVSTNQNTNANGFTNTNGNFAATRF